MISLHQVFPMSLEKCKQVAPFHFYVSIGKYAGLSAASYEDFVKMIMQVKAESLNFHLERGDFEKWATDVLKDKKLTEEIAKIRNRKLHGQTLRNCLHKTVSSRLKELTNTP
jgi:hypothetical protein